MAMGTIASSTIGGQEAHDRLVGENTSEELIA
jgi:hypothetical protein